MRKLLPALLVLVAASETSAWAQKVSFRADHTILVESRPYFPIGLYYCDEEFRDPSGKLLTELRDYGFNTAGYYRWGEPTWRKELELADRVGLKVWIRGINGLAVDSEATATALREQVQQTKEQRALLFWEFQDEPLYNNVPVAQAARGEKLVKGLDPDHPLLTVEWPGSVARFADWQGLGDLYGTDLYPIPREKAYGAHPNHDLTQMRDYLAAIRRARGDRPMMLVLQAWNWDPLKYGRAGYPTPAESRFMAYQAVIHGAKALFYYGQFHCTRPNSAAGLASTATDPAVRDREFQKCLELNAGFWDEHRPFFQELRQASRIFVLPDQRTGAIKLSSATPTIETLVKADGGRQYVLAVNASADPLDAEFALPPDLKNTELHVLFEKRTLPVNNGRFTDKFAGYGVHVYATSPELPADP